REFTRFDLSMSVTAIFQQLQTITLTTRLYTSHLPRTPLLSEVHSGVVGRATRDTSSNHAGTVANREYLGADRFSQAGAPRASDDANTTRARNCLGAPVYPHA